MSDQQEKTYFCEAWEQTELKETLRQLLARKACGHTLARRAIANAKAIAKGRLTIGKTSNWRLAATTLVSQMLEIGPNKATMLVSEMCENKIYV